MPIPAAPPPYSPPPPQGTCWSHPLPVGPNSPSLVGVIARREAVWHASGCLRGCSAWIRARASPRQSCRCGARRCSSTCAAERADGLRPLRRRLHPLLHRLQLPRDRAAGRGRRQRLRRPLRLRPRVRGRARAGGDRLRAAWRRTRSTRGSSIRCESWPACSRELGVTGPIGADQDGYPGILGYQGPALSEVTGQPVRPLAPFIESMMVRKSEAEVELIRESARWCEHAHRLLQEYTRPGATEAEASLRAGHEATLAMLEALDGSYGGQQASSDGVSAGYRGQIGLRSSWAHAVAHNIEFRGGRRPRHRDERADLGLQRRARARDDHRRADRRDAPAVRPHGRRAAGRLRGAAARA